ncbi:potassium-transporting ATPase subunit KdpA [Klebsiella pneumoniae]|nr:potassium-transporting ATPase subunit KdpA [Klebsiella pneumoniae]
MYRHGHGEDLKPGRGQGFPLLHPEPHGFSEVLYAVTSAANNNGSAWSTY